MAFGKVNSGKESTVIVNTVIGTGVQVIASEIVGDGDMLVSGKVEGNIAINGSLVVEPTGSVYGDVTASPVFVSGTVTGNIYTEFNCVEISSSGAVIGDIVCSALRVESGGRYEGNCRVTQQAMSLPPGTSNGQLAIDN